MITNSKQVENIYGYWPSFHDAEIISIALIRSLDQSSNIANAIIQLNYWETKALNKSTPELDYTLDKNMLITLEFKGLHSSHVQDFNHQNVIDELILKNTANAIEAEFVTIHGVDIKLSCSSISVVSVEPFN